MKSTSWFAVRKELSPRRKLIFGVVSFLFPLLVWCMVSYVPFIWHPKVHISNPGDVDYFQPGMLVDQVTFVSESDNMKTQGKATPEGTPANPLYLPAPHEVGKAFYTAFTTAPQQRDGKWLHESL